MIQAAKIIGTGLATTGLIGEGVGIGVVSDALSIASVGICSMSQPESGPANPGPGEIWETVEVVITFS